MDVGQGVVSVELERDSRHGAGNREDVGVDARHGCGERPGAELNFEFDGNALAFYILAGPDAGMIEYAIDGGAPQRLNAFHDYSAGLHYPRAITLADALKDARHTVKLRLLDEKDSRSKGTALRILQIAVNRGE